MHVKWISILFLIILFAPFPGYANSCDPDKATSDEILLEMRVNNLLRFDLDGYLCGDVLYLPLQYLFSNLGVDFDLSDDRRRFTVDFPDMESAFQFNFPRLRVHGSGGTINIDELDLLFTDAMNDIYIRKELIEEIFNLTIHFDYSALRLLVFSPHELPVISDYRRKEGYDNFHRPGREFTPDREYSASRSLLDGWFLDWLLNSSHNRDRQNYTYGFSLGGELMGGELSLSARGTAAGGINWNNYRGRWRYPIYSTPVIRQVIVGDQAHDHPFGRGIMQFQGLEITNRPNNPRQQFDEFRIADRLQQGWDVELYENSSMIDLARGNEVDSFSFSEPEMYGTNRYTLRYYSPDGFSHEENFFTTTPRSLLPPGEFEYSISAGNYRFDATEFARAQADMGVSSALTVGGGYHVMRGDFSEYEQTPFVQSTMRLARRLILEGSHTFGHTSEGSLRYTFRNGRSVTAEARKYYQLSQFNRSQMLFDGSLNASFPVNLGFLNLSTFITARNIRYSRHQDLNLFGGIRTALPFGFMMQMRMSTVFRDYQSSGFEPVRNDISISASRRVLRRFLLRPGLDYDHRFERISAYRLEASSRVGSSGNFSLSFIHDQVFDQSRFQFSFRYNFSTARYSSRTTVSDRGNPTFNHTASGTVAFDTKNRTLHTDNRSWVGKASLHLEPYLVIGSDDGRSVLDSAGEQMNVDIYANGIKQPVYRDGAIIKNLVPYEEYTVRIDAGNLDNPLWRIESEVYKILVIPNVVNRLPIPVVAMGEVSGRVESTRSDPAASVRGLTVDLQKEDGSFSKRVRTYSSGDFYYVGLKPGEYKAVLDHDQLSVRSMRAVRDSVGFTIHATKRGDIADGLILKTETITDEQPDKIYSVQVGAFSLKSNASDFTASVEMDTSLEVEIFHDPGDGLYKCRIGFFNEEDARQFQQLLQEEHAPRFRDAFLIRHEL